MSDLKRVLCVARLGISEIFIVLAKIYGEPNLADNI